MDRRAFSKLMLGAAANVAAAPPGLANPFQDRDERERAFERVTLSIGAQRLVLTWLVIFHATQLWGIDLRQPLAQYNENRARLGGVPILQGLVRPDLRARFLNAAIIGYLVLYGPMLVLVPRRELRVPSRTIIAHRDHSWDAPGPAQRVTIPGLTPPVLRGLARVGHARERDGELLVLVQPSVIQLEDER